MIFSKGLSVLREQCKQARWLSGQPALLVWALLMGVLGAMATIFFYWGIHQVQLLLSGQSGSIVSITRGWSTPERILYPALGGLVAGLLLWWGSKLKVDSNADYMEAVAIGNGHLSLRQGFLRILSSLSVIATGGSVGREGAMIHLAAMGASATGRFFCFEVVSLRLLVACGAAAGVSAAYNAPIAGALFVAEIVLGSMSMQSLGPLLLSAATANITMRTLGYYHVMYDLPELMPVSPHFLVFAIFLGIVSGLLAPQFLRFLDYAKRLFKKTGLGLPLRLALGGFVLGLFTLLEPRVAGNGYSVLNSFLHEPWAWSAVAVILLTKVLSTGITVGSGAVGGVITPVMFVGGALGLLSVQLLSLLLPVVPDHPALFVLLGMGSFLAAATSAPLMAIIMIFEMTHSYTIILPLMLACVFSYFTARSIAGAVMYAVTESRDKDLLLRHRLRQLRLANLVSPVSTVIKHNQTVQDALNMFIEYGVRFIYVVNEMNEYQGVIAHKDISSFLLSGNDLRAPVSGELINRSYVTALHPDMTLDEVLDYFVSFSGERLPVLSADERPILLGVVYKSDVLKKFNELKRLLDASSEAILDVRARKLYDNGRK
ncbi:ClcB-like voltage-gated chloride channel protein [Advenella sp. RU8]|uniref:ClcB-like voltage-gated chloride channel protein n=1 Tax=Advenella sp. RU8 TaxID=3399575 RepID=UPI003AAC56F9